MRVPPETSRTGRMVPPGGRTHIAGREWLTQSDTMCAFRRRWSLVRRGWFLARRGWFLPRLPRAVLVALGGLSVLASVLASALWARGIGNPVSTGRPAQHAGPSAAPAHRAARPRIVPRSAWLDSSTGHSQPPPRYDDKVVAVFVHHTDSPNGYACADTPRIIRYLYEGQTGARSWDDIGYNFLVDRCGTIYEGRAGGVERGVTGAHTQGFNHRTAGIAAIGTFTAGVPVPRAMTDAIAALAAWKLGLSDVDPRGRTRLVSSNGLSRYQAGTTATLPTLAGHNDGYPTNCPGAALSALLPQIRERAARLQGRMPPAPPPAKQKPRNRDEGEPPRRSKVNPTADQG
ncbi:peptidoglycan recognition protein [Streptomyces sp. NPDC046805]|uniref:peptidoglycan recognition protein family protein n=1 Tax=Streptomyces sp. NPDC046805 TaxID=3155134 RepID=UPI0033E3CF7E